jgi:hypothetical protein
MKVSRPVAMPALPEGLFMLFALLETLEHIIPRNNSGLSPVPFFTGRNMTGEGI